MLPGFIQAAIQFADTYPGAMQILNLVATVGCGVFIGTVRTEIRELKRRISCIGG